MKVFEKQVIELKKWMLENSVRQVDVAKRAGVSNTAVCLFMQGKMTSANIKDAFLNFGCPEELLTEVAA